MVTYNESWVSIANEALSKIGNDQIEDLQSGDNTSQFCNSLLTASIRKVFGMHNWNCLKTRVQLSPLVETPSFGYSYKFQLPENFTKIVEINVDDYTVEGDKILADSTLVELVYICLPEDATKISPSVLRSALVASLASSLAVPLAGSNSIANQLGNEFILLLAEAKIQNDGKPEISEEYISGDGTLWTSVR